MTADASLAAVRAAMDDWNTAADRALASAAAAVAAAQEARETCRRALAMWGVPSQGEGG